MGKERFAAVILNYKVYEDTFECIDSLLKMNYEKYWYKICEKLFESGFCLWGEL